MFTILQDNSKILSLMESYEGRWVIFKHSDSCPISRGALTEVEMFDKKHTQVPILYLEVKSQRKLSNWIEQEFGVEHESPQALLFKGNTLKADMSHGSISKKRLAHMVSGGYHDDA